MITMGVVRDKKDNRIAYFLGRILCAGIWPVGSYD